LLFWNPGHAVVYSQTCCRTGIALDRRHDVRAPSTEYEEKLRLPTSGACLQRTGDHQTQSRPVQNGSWQIGT